MYKGSAGQCLLPIPGPETNTQPALEQEPMVQIILEPLTTWPNPEGGLEFVAEPKPTPGIEQQQTPDAEPGTTPATEKMIAYPTFETIIESEQNISQQYSSIADLLEAGPSQPYNDLEGISLYSPAETFNLEDEAEWRCRTPIEVERCCQAREMEKDWELENAQAELENTQPKENPKQKKKRSGLKRKRGHKKGNVRLPKYKKEKK